MASCGSGVARAAYGRLLRAAGEADSAAVARATGAEALEALLVGV